MEENNSLKIRKVHLNTFIEILIDLYNKGVDYVDIIGSMDKGQDSIGISFSKEYMSKEHQENFNKIHVTSKTDDEINIKLSDEDLNQLL